MKVLTYKDANDENNNHSSYLLLAPSITPLLKNNPAIRIVKVDTNRKLVADYDQYYLDLVLATRTYK